MQPSMNIRKLKQMKRSPLFQLRPMIHKIMKKKEHPKDQLHLLHNLKHHAHLHTPLLRFQMNLSQMKKKQIHLFANQQKEKGGT